MTMPLDGDGLEPVLTGHVVPPSSARPIAAKILIVDDDPRNLLAVEEMLRAPGYELVLVQSGEEALRQVLANDFALILLDVQMPRIDGYEVAALIRNRSRSSRVPIIFLTAFNTDELQVFRGYTAGAVDYVFKPIQPVILRSKIEVFVDLYRKTEEVRQHADEERRLLMENLRIRGEKLQAEQELRRRDEQHSLILRALPLVLYNAEAGGAGQLQFVSDNVAQVTGFTAAEFLKEGFWTSRLHPEDRGHVLRQFETLAQSHSVTMEYRLQAADGSERHILDQAILVRDEAGLPREVFGLWLDVTDRKQMELRLVHASKLEALGRLTGGIAHDFNNMLSVVIGSLDLLNRSLQDDDRAKKRVSMAMEGAQRCAALTSRLLAFSRRQPLRSEHVDVRELVNSMEEMLDRTLGDSIDLAIEAAVDAWPVMTDRSQLESVLLNLVLNARDAMTQGGRLLLRVVNVPAKGEEPDSLVVSVTDTGTGMPPEVKERVFEPFFTTKELGRGTGLGLSTAYGFAKQSGGEIDIDSTLGVGTTVSLHLPRSSEDAPIAAAQDLVKVKREGRGQCVLVVEDDPKVREVARSTIESLGYEVLEAGDALAARAVLDAREDVKLVFSDVNMPGAVNGIALCREIQEHRPHVHVLLTSGFLNEDRSTDGVDLLLKPYRADDLAARMHTLLGNTN